MSIMNNVKILYFDKIDLSEGIDINKTSKPKECDTMSLFIFFKERV